MQDGSIPIVEEAEAKIRQRLLTELADCLELTGFAYGTAAAILKEPIHGETDRPSKVLLWHLLCRLSTDLRSVEILCESGYPLQSRSLAAGLLEVTKTIIVAVTNMPSPALTRVTVTFAPTDDPAADSAKDRPEEERRNRACQRHQKP